jgi:hypothetical protein
MTILISESRRKYIGRSGNGGSKKAPCSRKKKTSQQSLQSQKASQMQIYH